MTRLIVIAGLSLAVIPASMQGQQGTRTRPAAEGCRTDFDSLHTWISRDYAGYLDRKRDVGGRLDELTESIRRQVRGESNTPRCTAALQRYIALFRETDHHLELWEPAVKPSSSTDVREHDAGPDIALSFTEDSAAIFRIASFGQQNKAVIDSVVRANRARLLQTPYLVIDVRGNGGGWNAAYESITPFLYTNPITVDGMEGWVSKGTIQNIRDRVASPDTPEQLKVQFRQLLMMVEGREGSFILLGNNSEIRRDTVYENPRRVAILIDRRCVSSCEQFLLDARQSSKVSILGSSNTRGLLDYGNAQTRMLPSGLRKVAIPASRSLRLPAHPLDATGVAPTVRIPSGEKDPIRFALRYLRAR